VYYEYVKKVLQLRHSSVTSGLQAFQKCHKCVASVLQMSSVISTAHTTRHATLLLLVPHRGCHIGVTVGHGSNGAFKPVMVS
jgi:hypothetical protein